jgi:hypothetical protein
MGDEVTDGLDRSAGFVFAESEQIPDGVRFAAPLRALEDLGSYRRGA